MFGSSEGAPGCCDHGEAVCGELWPRPKGKRARVDIVGGKVEKGPHHREEKGNVLITGDARTRT